MTAAQSAFVIILTVLNIAGACWLMLAMRRRRSGDAAPGAETTGHVWDGDLAEYNNPLPRWWLWLFFISVGFSVVYLVLYPGLGNFAGRLGWTSAGQHAELQRASEAQAALLMERFAGKSVAQLRNDPEALKIGRNLFANNCAICHGADAHGNPGFPNLTDADWLYGGSPEQVETTISGGRNGVMIAWQDALGSDGVENVLAYVLSLSGREVPAGDAAAGAKIFATNCVACHGADAKGNQLLGAPNLTDQVWLYGGSVDAVRDSIAKGRQGHMPAQLVRLGPQRVKLLAAYVLSLGARADDADAAGHAAAGP
jgi:cytochrome c oxidase cbb3-type subunit 3